MNNIVLTGFMGTGKTTSGRILAEKLGWNFIDVDRKIEEYCNMLVSDIFAQYGEKYFREQERIVIKKLIDCQNSVIATGGGAVLSDVNRSNLKKCGVIVCLNARPETIVRRLEQDKVVRPLLSCPKRLERVTKLLQERHAKYQTADLCINTDSINPCEVADNIIKYITVSFKSRNSQFGIDGENELTAGMRTDEIL